MNNIFFYSVECCASSRDIFYFYFFFHFVIYLRSLTAPFPNLTLWNVGAPLVRRVAHLCICFAYAHFTNKHVEMYPRKKKNKWIIYIENICHSDLIYQMRAFCDNFMKSKQIYPRTKSCITNTAYKCIAAGILKARIRILFIYTYIYYEISHGSSFCARRRRQ